jgi:hypothetical protein
MAIDGAALRALKTIDGCTWGADWDSAPVADGAHVLSVTAAGVTGQNTDRIARLVKGGNDTPPWPQAVDYKNTLGEWPEKHILGTPLGPNKNGRHWPARHGRKQATR